MCVVNCIPYILEGRNKWKKLIQFILFLFLFCFVFIFVLHNFDYVSFSFISICLLSDLIHILIDSR